MTPQKSLFDFAPPQAPPPSEEVSLLSAEDTTEPWWGYLVQTATAGSSGSCDCHSKVLEEQWRYHPQKAAETPEEAVAYAKAYLWRIVEWDRQNTRQNPQRISLMIHGPAGTFRFEKKGVTLANVEGILDALTFADFAPRETR